MANDLLPNNSRTAFESIKLIDKSDQEYWLARELMPLLGYDQWKNFHKVILRAIESLSQTYPQVADHFAEVSKKIKVAAGTGKEAERSILDYRLTRYACYLIAQNGDPKKSEIALAQSYFATQTRKRELYEEQEKAIERIVARRKLSETEKKFSGVLQDHEVDSQGIAEIRSAGDEALFNRSTQEMKQTLGIKSSKPLADHLPTITLKAKDLATEITTFNTQSKQLHGKASIKSEHISNNLAVRQLLNQSGINPESLPPEEDVRKLEQRLAESEERIDELKNSNELTIDIRGVTDEAELLRIKTVIDANPGQDNLLVLYGEFSSPQQLVRKVTTDGELFASLKKYIKIQP